MEQRSVAERRGGHVYSDNRTRSHRRSWPSRVRQHDWRDLLYGEIARRVFSVEQRPRESCGYDWVGGTAHDILWPLGVSQERCRDLWRMGACRFAQFPALGSAGATIFAGLHRRNPESAATNERSAIPRAARDDEPGAIAEIEGRRHRFVLCESR